MYTIAANLTDESEGKGAKDYWINYGAIDLSWKNAEERKDIVGWLGDAVYIGNTGVSFGQDDYIADLDTDNIVHRIDKDESFLDSTNRYYQEMKEFEKSEHEFRTIEFLKNNPYEQVEQTILMRAAHGYSPIVEGGVLKADPLASIPKLEEEIKPLTMEELKSYPNYRETCEFLEELKTYGE